MPISASVAITPRTRSLPHRIDDGLPDRLVDHGPPRGRGIGIAAVQNMAAGLLAGAQRFDQRRPEPFGHQSAAPVERGETALIVGRADRGECIVSAVRPDQQAGAAGRSRVGGIRRKLPPGQPHRAPRSSTMRDGSRLTRYEYRDTRTSTPSKACADTAAPPMCPSRSSSRTRRPARAR